MDGTDLEARNLLEVGGGARSGGTIQAIEEGLQHAKPGPEVTAVAISLVGVLMPDAKRRVVGRVASYQAAGHFVGFNSEFGEVQGECQREGIDNFMVAGYAVLIDQRRQAA
jgi:hypothetical protein